MELMSKAVFCTSRMREHINKFYRDFRKQSYEETGHYFLNSKISYRFLITQSQIIYDNWENSFFHAGMRNIHQISIIFESINIKNKDIVKFLSL